MVAATAVHPNRMPNVRRDKQNVRSEMEAFAQTAARGPNVRAMVSVVRARVQAKVRVRAGGAVLVMAPVHVVQTGPVCSTTRVPRESNSV